jgi:hypothetical protein
MYKIKLCILYTYIYVILHLAYVDTSPVYNMQLTINTTSNHQSETEVRCRNFRSQKKNCDSELCVEVCDGRIELFIYVTMLYKLRCTRYKVRNNRVSIFYCYLFTCSNLREGHVHIVAEINRCYMQQLASYVTNKLRLLYSQ